jgi:hypothetical protein
MRMTDVVTVFNKQRNGVVIMVKRKITVVS